MLAAVSARAGDNWPNLHGPTNDSHTDSTGLPLTWSETENVVWKTAIHDTGWSSPVVWGDQIWLTTATDDGKKSFAICVDRNKGAIVYDRLLFETAKPQDTRQYNSYASPTPVIEEGRVYVHFGSYGTACLDTKTGETIWSRVDLPCLHWRGPGASPILFENLMIVQMDDYDHQYVVALDKLTGKTVWKKDREVDYGTTDGDVMKAYGTPIVIDVDGELQLISPTSKATLAYNPRTGDELWRIRYGGFSTAARPLVGHGMLFLNSGFPKGELFGMKLGGHGDLTKTNIAWNVKKNVPSKPSSVLVGDLIFSIDDQGVATCIEARSGEVLFAERIGGNFSASALYAEDRIYFFGHDGKTTVIAPERKLRVLATSQLDSGFRASPAVSGRSLILRTEKDLYRIEQAK